MIQRLRTTRSQQGFTLIEVMVAVMVIAIVLPALALNMMQQADGTGYIRDKTIAQWVAANKMAEIRLVNRASGEVPKKKESGVETMAGRDWYWNMQTREFPQEELKGLWGVQIKVRANEDDKDGDLVTLVGIVFDSKSNPGGMPSNIPGVPNL